MNVIVFTAGTEVVGESYCIICTVTGAETLDAQIVTTWGDPGGNVVQSGGTTLVHDFTSLQLSDAGQYTCTASVTSPYLDNTLTRSTTQSINLMGKQNK